MNTIKRAVLVGFGNIGQGLIPFLADEEGVQLVIFDGRVNLSKRAFAEQHGAKLVEQNITNSNYRDLLGKYLDEQSILMNFAVSVSTVDLALLAQEKGALYIDSCIEPWDYDGERSQPSLITNFELRELIKNLQEESKGKSTVLVAHGANPGFISILLKKALYEMARANGIAVPEDFKSEWGKAAFSLGIKTIQISERDTQVSSTKRSEDEFCCTWSVDGFVTECLQSSELGWGTHEREIPDGAIKREARGYSALELRSKGMETKVKSWSPNYLGFEGFLLTHNEALSIAEYLRFQDGNVSYQPTVFYAYHPCDEAINSLPLLESVEHDFKKRDLRLDVVSGIDELGVFLISDKYPSFWVGSNLSIGKARKISPFCNATTLQVVSGVMAAIKWMDKNPRLGFIESEDLDWRFLYEQAVDFWSPIVVAEVLWHPSEGGGLEFDRFLVNS